MPWVLAWFGIGCALATAISLWPPHRPGFAAVGAWLVGWLVSELALHHFVIQLVVGAFLVAAGGVDELIGLVGVVGLGSPLAGLASHVRMATATTRVVERGLAAGLGRAYHDAIAPDVRAAYDPTTSWGRLAAVLPWQPAAVVRVATA